MLMPYIIRRKFEKERIEDWKKKTLEEYEAWAGHQEEAQKRAIINRVRESIMDPDMFEGYPFQAYSYLKHLKENLPPELTEGLIIPEGYEEMMEAAEEAVSRVIIAMQAKSPIMDEDIGTLVKAFGHEPTAEYVGQIQKVTGEEERVKVRREEIGLEEKKLTVRREELEAKGKPKGKEALKERLLMLGKKEKIFADQMKEIEAGTLDIDDPEAKKIEGKLKKVRDERLSIINQMIGELDKKKVDGIVAKLKKGGATPEGLDLNREEFMKAEGLTDIEYEYIKINLSR